jgi:predicted AAA+ superfamily ATPase
MKRFVVEKLLHWHQDHRRKPLILRGARQVGKTWAVKEFAKQQFQDRIHLVDCEKYPDLHKIFAPDLDIRRILSELELFFNRTITPGQDLLFFDEIQSCPRAIMALRYFFEDLPGLSIIAAGSLLEFALADISFPVGRVQFLNLYPMTFVEFLTATGKNLLAQKLVSGHFPLSENIHQMLLEQLRLYFFVGGMPECVKTFRDDGKLVNIFAIQENMIQAYRADFAKYAPYSDKLCLNAVLSNTAKTVGNQIKYSRLADSFSSPTNKKAFDLLTMAQVVRKIPSTSAAGLPLGASASERKFKALVLDIGLMQSLCGLNINEQIFNKDLLGIYNGALAEQFVGQELLACGNDNLYYWARDAKSSSAEVDYLIENNGEIIPLEIKSGAAGRLKSLHLLLKSYPDVSQGYVLSQRPYSELPEQKLIFMPLYAASVFGK